MFYFLSSTVESQGHFIFQLLILFCWLGGLKRHLWGWAGRGQNQDNWLKLDRDISYSIISWEKRLKNIGVLSGGGQLLPGSVVRNCILHHLFCTHTHTHTHTHTYIYGTRDGRTTISTSPSNKQKPLLMRNKGRTALTDTRHCRLPWEHPGRSESHLLSELTRQIALPTKTGHAPPPME